MPGGRVGGVVDEQVLEAIEQLGLDAAAHVDVL